jgi:hypothetical protein
MIETTGAERTGPTLTDVLLAATTVADSGDRSEIMSAYRDLGAVGPLPGPPDFAAPETAARIGRVWPSPSAWRLDDAERRVDQAWRASLGLDAETVRQLWESETITLLAFMGAKADHAVEGNDRA